MLQLPTAVPNIPMPKPSIEGREASLSRGETAPGPVKKKTITVLRKIARQEEARKKEKGES